MMIPPTEEEYKIALEMLNYDEDSEEYKALQKKLHELREQHFIGCPFEH